MFSVKFKVPPELRKQALRYPDVAAYSITDTLRRTDVEARRFIRGRYPMVAKLHLDIKSMFFVHGATRLTLVGWIKSTSKRVPMAPLVTNLTATATQKGIPVRARTHLQYVGLRGAQHTLPHGFMFRNKTEVSNPGYEARRFVDPIERLQTFRPWSISELLRTPVVREHVQAFMVRTFTIIFARKLDSMK